MSLLSAPQILGNQGEARSGEARPGEQATRPGFVQGILKKALTHRLRQIEHGRLCLRDGQSVELFGSADAGGDTTEIVVRDPRFYSAVVLHGTLGAAEAYMDDSWSSNDLVGLFRLLTKNAQVMSAMDGGLARWLRTVGVWAHFFRRNTLAGSRRNIQAHYDLGNDFYALFLDDTMTYSAGMFLHPQATMREASLAKYERICRKLELSAHDHLLEIGTGWGGFAVHAARNYGCRVTTTTLSRRQFEYAQRKVVEAGLVGRVTVLCEDYRNLTGMYDKLVSIEMIEAVGQGFLDGYFKKCSSLLNAGGLMALQAITIPDYRHDAYLRSVEFLQKYIFPGSCVPSFSAMANSIRRQTDFRVLHLEDFGCHYAETLARWRARFWENIDGVRALGFDERFIRMWHYYLCYCEAGFRDHQIGVAQMVLAKPDCRRAPIL